MFSNILLNTDSYKASHYLQYPANTSVVSSYIEARGGVFDSAVFFGLQAFLKQYLSKPITTDDVDEAELVLTVHGVPFYRQGWESIINKHGGYLPVEIQAVAEGSVLPTGNALVQIKNTDSEAYWLTSYLETALLRAIWYPATVATLSWYTKKIIARYLDETSDDPSAKLPFALHDFGARGVSSQESAALGGMAHLVSFQGTDTLSALVAARRYYAAEMAGFSIPATEHSTMTAWGKDNEADAYANILKQFGRDGAMFAVVSDSYDIYNAVSNIWGKQLRQQVEDSGATLVVRPDSGQPEVVVLEVLERLYAEFGGTVNRKGYKVLADCVRVIQGDGVNLESIEVILRNIKDAGFSADNIAFGMGGGLLQKVDRDTLGFAMKASAVRVDEQWRDVFKQPVTDKAKHSKKGRLALISTPQGITTIREDALVDDINLLRPVFVNGRLLIDDDFSTVRARSERRIF
ncbi:nicotinate phosphoribosyltransferase [Leucothrix pacifica]|uniref:Nicotinamide phosphoribosyltransferase n=1 Tax=Leucothrix pacifica TaxID=1247513 RepID=A0A317CLB8_9GAMM|nr:nicotinate phosphoribosyltransferase [Leucothrix pacifica]PWQ97130.1 nicotinate phosphoribosyltransferase [Leucothrix pacifica]